MAAGALFGGEAVPPGPGGSVARLKVFVRVSQATCKGRSAGSECGTCKLVAVSMLMLLASVRH